MEDPGLGAWGYAGSALGAIFAGVAGFFTGKGRKSGAPEENPPSNTVAQELRQLQGSVMELEKRVHQTEFVANQIQVMIDRFLGSVERIHERIDGIDRKLANMEGYQAGREGKP